MMRLLRLSALGIAIAAFIDPPITMTARSRPRIAVGCETSTCPLILSPSKDERVKHPHEIVDRLEAALRSDFDLVYGTDDTAAAAIVIGAAYPDRVFPPAQRVFTVSTGRRAGEANVRITARAPRTVPRGTLIHLEVDVDAVQAAGTTTTLVARAGKDGVEVGRVTHPRGTGESRWRASLDVTPVGLPPWLIRVEASGLPAERIVEDNVVDLAVDLAPPIRVLVHEARPSWAAAFVRRALERDARFSVTSRTLPSRGIQITSGTASLADLSSDAFQVLIAGGLDRLTSAEASTMQRFMRDREGLVVLLPDSGADARRIAPWFETPEPTEVLLEQPAPLATDPPLRPIDASELLTFPLGPGDRALARAAGSGAAVVSVSPRGGGRLLTSGALDAWRYRASGEGAFDRFWQSTIAGLGADVPPLLDARIVPDIVAPGGKADVVVRVRRAELGLPAGAPLRVGATLANGDPIRLWPDAQPDSFRGSLTAPAVEGPTHITVTAGPHEVDPAVALTSSAMARFIVSSAAHAAAPGAAPLALLAESHGGIDVTPDRLSELERDLRAKLEAPTIRITRHPMRSVWWLLPFGACLSAEWWIRRRRGLR